MFCKVACRSCFLTVPRSDGMKYHVRIFLSNPSSTDKDFAKRKCQYFFLRRFLQIFSITANVSRLGGNFQRFSATVPFARFHCEIVVPLDNNPLYAATVFDEIQAKL